MIDHSAFPYSYIAFNLRILSQLKITGFTPAQMTEADVHVFEGLVPEALDNPVNRSALYQSTDTEFLLRVENVAAYYVKGGREITVQRLGTASDGEISAYLTGASFGALMHQRRQLPLHAAAVLFRGKCILICGISGAGKSTLATALIQAGGMLVADDISVIDFSGDKARVCPAFPTIKIREDSLKHLGIEAKGLEQVRGELRKYYLSVGSFNKNYIPIDHIFILRPHNLSHIVKQELQGVDKFKVLKKHTYLFMSIPKTGLEVSHFELVNRLAASVPVTVIARPAGIIDTEKLVQVIAGS